MQQMTVPFEKRGDVNVGRHISGHPCIPAPKRETSGVSPPISSPLDTILLHRFVIRQ